MKISIAICTWNRSHLLNQTLQSVASLEIPPAVDWEVVVVDNGSTDDTRQVIDSFQDSIPVQYVSESTRGHAVSRNTAIAHVTGDYVIWTDNDVVVPQNWLSGYFDGFQRHPQAAFFGGKIEPVFEQTRPAWLEETWEKCKGVYATRDLGDAERPLGDGDFPYGANFAVRTDVQRQFQYETVSGRKGGSLVGDDEIAVLKRISEAGHNGIWLPNVAVQHFITAERATTDYVSRYFVGQGQTNIIRGKVEKTAGQAWLEAVRFKWKWKLKRYLSPAEEWVSHMIRASLSRGEYLAIREQENSGA